MGLFSKLRLNYFILTLKHKWYVFCAGLKTKTPIWRLIIHDWSKFTPAEYPHYQKRFFEGGDNTEEFQAAWLHHQNLNPHHWDYWISRSPHTIGKQGEFSPAALPMPKWAVREMVADWMGASRAYTGETNIMPWLCKNYKCMYFHEKSIEILRTVLEEQGFYWPGDKECEKEKLKF